MSELNGVRVYTWSMELSDKGMEVPIKDYTNITGWSVVDAGVDENEFGFVIEVERKKNKQLTITLTKDALIEMLAEAHEREQEVKSGSRRTLVKKTQDGV